MLPWTDILIAIKWYAGLLVLGFLGWVVLSPYAKKIPGFGYAAGRAVGLVLIGGLTWMFSVLHIFDFTQQNIWVIVLVSFAFLWNRRHEVLKTIKENWKEILISELATLVFFLIAILMKSNKPQITDIEKYMDSAFIGAAIRSTSGVPLDPWYAGSVINYYYVGHWFMAVIAKMTNTAPNYAFNLAYSTVMAVVGANVFLTGWTISKRKLGGILSGFFVLLSSNIHPLWALIHNTPNYFFFSSGRFIQEVINEYPVYSFVVGDVHAHSMSMILTTCLILSSIVLYQSEKKNYVVIGFMGLLMGLMFGVNAFDDINYGIFSALVLFIFWLQRKPTILGGIKMLIVFVIPALVPFLIFKSTFIAPVGGLGFTLWPTPLSHIFNQFGLFFYTIIIFIGVLIAFHKKEIKNFYNNLKFSNFVKSILSLLENSSAENIVLAVLAIVGFTLVILPEFVFVKDIYFIQNPPFARANTVFKIWYEAWVMLGLVSGVGASIFITLLSKKYSIKGKVISVLVILVPISIGAYGYWVGLKTLKDLLPNTINGIDYTRKLDGVHDYGVVEWARENIKGQPLVLEATGQSYTTYNWFSAFTGLPTIIGWESHEWGWRYDKDAWNKVATRMGAVEGLYKTKNPEDLKNKAMLMGISFILISPNEIQLYSVDSKIFKKAFGEPVYDDGKAMLFSTGYVGKESFLSGL